MYLFIQPGNVYPSGVYDFDPANPQAVQLLRGSCADQLPTLEAAQSLAQAGNGKIISVDAEGNQTVSYTNPSTAGTRC